MVRARTDSPKPQFPTQPLPKPPLENAPTGCFGGIIPKETLNKLADNIEFNQKDKNHDNSLNSTELYGRPFGELPQVEKMQRYDTNHDGQVDRDEYHAGRNAERASRMDLPDFKKIGGALGGLGGIGAVAGEVAGKVDKQLGEEASQVLDAINPF